MPKGGGKYHVGNPYQVAGRWFTPKEQPNYDKVGVSSWYGEAFHRRKTSNGEWFNMNDLTAAHATLPLPSYAKVTNLENGRDVIVRINDRGPFVGTRIIDVSKRSADALGFRNNGMAKVRVQWIGVAPINDDGSHLIAMNEALGQGQGLRGLQQLAQNSSGGRTQFGTQLAAREPRAEDGQGLAKRQLASLASNEAVGAGGKSFIIQVAAFAELDNARSARQMVHGLGPSQLVETEGSSGPMYRLQVGPVQGEEAAIHLLEAIQAEGFQDARMVSTRIQQVAAAP